MIEAGRAALLIHVGLHKTGTTTLQRTIFEPLAGRSIEYVGERARIYGRFIVPGAHAFSPEAARADFAPLTEAASRVGRLAVISGEGLGGRPFHQKFYRAVIAERLARTFPDARILITIREQRALIYSMYGQYVRFGYTATLADFLHEPRPDSGFQPILDRDYYDFALMLKEYERFFPPEHILVLPLERLSEDPVAAMAGLSDSLGHDLDVSGVTGRGETRNPAWSDLAYAVARRINRTLVQDARWRRPWLLDPNRIAPLVDRVTPARMRRRMRTARLAMIDRALGDRYALSNATVAARLGMDLARYGYRVAEKTPAQTGGSA